MEIENGGYKPRKVPVMTGGEKYSAEPVIENTIGEWWYWFSEVTKKIRDKRVTLPMRQERAEMYKRADEIRETPIGSEERKKYLEEYKIRTRIEREFVDQKDLEVDTPWDKLGSKYCVLNAEAGDEKPPIVVIPGASNGMESMDSFIRELARQNLDRRIVAIGYPDAPSGKMTEKFYKAVKNNYLLGPHAVYFEEAIKKLIPEGDFELGAYSAGGAIAEMILSRQEFADRVTNSWILNPFGNYPMKEAELAKGIAHENMALVKYLKGIPRYVFVDDKNRDEQKRLKFNTWVEIGKRCTRDVLDGCLGKMKVKDGGKIAVIYGTEDEVTKAAKRFDLHMRADMLHRQPNMKFGEIEGSLHAGVMMEPEKYVEMIDRVMA